MTQLRYPVLHKNIFAKILIAGYDTINILIYVILHDIICPQFWRQLSKLQKLILYLLTSIVIISLLLWFIKNSKNLEELSETNSVKLPQPTVWPQDIVSVIILQYCTLFGNELYAGNYFI